MLPQFFLLFLILIIMFLLLKNVLMRLLHVDINDFKVFIYV